MTSAPYPLNEKDRLRSLKGIGILDTPIDERFERITRIVCHSLNVPISAISLVDEGRQWFKSVQGLDVSETPREAAFCAHTILKDQPLIVSDAQKDERFVDNPLVISDPHIRFYAGYPLILEENIRIGTLCAIDRVPRKLTEDMAAVLQDLTKIVCSELRAYAVSKSNQKLVTELEYAERAALVDPLSRLWNRAGGEKLAHREWAAAKRDGTPISIAMLDLDHFKTINDEYGHDVGDQAIRQVSRTALSSLRPHDVISRWGGEEFMIVLTDCDEENLARTMDRLLHSIRTTPVESTKGSISLTASAGACTVYPATDDNFSDFFNRADEALYVAKDSGRDCYILSGASANREKHTAE